MWILPVHTALMYFTSKKSLKSCCWTSSSLRLWYTFSRKDHDVGESVSQTLLFKPRQNHRNVTTAPESVRHCLQNHVFNVRLNLFVDIGVFTKIRVMWDEYDQMQSVPYSSHKLMIIAMSLLVRLSDAILSAWLITTLIVMTVPLFGHFCAN